LSVAKVFDRLYQENFSFVWAAARRCGATGERVDAVVVEVFAVAHRRVEELRWEISPQAWLYGVTRDVATQLAQTAGAKQPGHNASRTMNVALDKLDPTRREAFQMADLLGMSAPEIASELSIHVDTLDTRLRSARRKMASFAGSEQQLAAEVSTTQRADRATRRDQERVYAALIAQIRSVWAPLKARVVPTLRVALVPAAALSLALASYLVTRSNNAAKAEAEAEAAAAESPAPSRSRDRPEGPYAGAPEPSAAAPETPAPPAAAPAPGAPTAPAAPGTPTATAPTTGTPTAPAAAPAAGTPTTPATAPAPVTAPSATAPPASGTTPTPAAAPTPAASPTPAPATPAAAPAAG